MHRLELVVVSWIVLFAVAAFAADSDSDGVDDAADNCVNVANNQFDADMDGYGNACDCDFFNDGSCDTYDQFSMAWCGINQAFPACELADMHPDGVIDSQDDALWTASYANGTPGSSGLTCAGGTDCGPDRPIPTLPIVQAYDRYPYNGLNQGDIDAAIAYCGTGCNLLFLADTYDDVTIEIEAFSSGLAMYGHGPGVTTLRSPIFGEDDWDELIFLGEDAPDGVRIESMTLDGRSREQGAPADGTIVDVSEVQGHIGILAGTPTTNYQNADAEIRKLEIRDFVYAGIIVWYAVDWVIEDNVVSGIGCHQVDVPCGDLIPLGPGQTNPWDGLDDLQTALPDRKMDGFGILTMSGSSGVVVEDNIVSRAAKYGIGAAHLVTDCESPAATRNIDFIGNEVYESATGIVANGGCQVTFMGNKAHDMVASGAEGANVGKGFTCGGDGEGLTWVDNDSWDNQGSGYGISCNHGGIVLDGNTSSGNCATVTWNAHDVDITGWADTGGNWSSGVTVVDLESNSSACSRGLGIHNRSEVSVSGGSITGGTLGGIWIQGAHDVEIEDLDVVSSDPTSGSDTGVFLSYNQTVDPGVDPLSEVYIQPTVNVTGFDTEVGFTAPQGLDDGDDVAYCALETTPPAGCDAP